MGVVIFSSGVVVGHQSLVPNGAYTSYTMTRTSGALPSAGYRIVSAVLTCTLRNAQWDTITAKSGSVTLGSFDAAGTSGERTCALSDTFGWANFTSLTLYGGGAGTQIASGSYVVVEVTWEYTTSTLALNKTSVDAGGSVTATIGYHDAAFTHKLILTFGSRSQTFSLAAATGSYTFSVPESWLDQIPKAVSGSASVTLQTLSGGSVIGEDPKTLTITCAASVIPSFSVACEPLLTVGGKTYPSMGAGVYVQTKSGVKASVTNSAAGIGANIASVSISVGSYTGSGFSKTGAGDLTLDSSLLPDSGSLTVHFSITDTRGMETENSITITVSAYAEPYASSFSAWRSTADGTVAPMGVIGSYSLAWSYSNMGQANTCTAALSIRAADQADWATVSSPAASGSSGLIKSDGANVALLTTKAYILRLALTDAYGTVSVTSEIPSARFAMHFSPDGTSVAFGAACQREGAVEIADDRTLWTHGKEILDLMYPVGAIYLSANAVSPASIYGGTWEQITDRFLLAAGSSYGAGSTGGAASVTLTKEQLPKISGSLLTGSGNDGSTAGGFGPIRSASGCLSVARERQYTSPTPGTSMALSGTYAELKLDIGGGQSVGILPPYLAVYVWKRIA